MTYRRSGGPGRPASILCVCALWLASAVSTAQEVGTPEKTPAGKAVLEPEIIVTGSRIPRPGFDTLEPATVVTADYLESRGQTNVADALNETPGFGVATTPEGDQTSYGPGLNFINRFGLGSNRTLTLINGRRFVSSNAPARFGPAAPGTQVDLNFIPAVLFDQVETLTVGGAPTYGSDAIAGVVNVKLKHDMQGVRASGQIGELEGGDGRNDSFGLAGGWNFAGDRGNFTASLQHSETDGVLATRNRRFADAYSFPTNPFASAVAGQIGRTPANDGRVNPDIPFNTGTSDGIPNAVLIRNRRLFGMNFGGVALPVGTNNLADGQLRCFGAAQGTCLQFAANGNLVPYNPGINFGSSDASGGDGLYLASTLQLTTDLIRNTGTASIRFDLTDHVRLFADAFVYKADAHEIVDQTAYNSISLGGSSGAITIPSTHPLLTQQAQDTLADLGVSTFRISRAHRDLATNRASSNTQLFQIATGATGGFEAAGRNFSWEAYVNYGHNDDTFYATQLNRQRFVNALNVVSVGGQMQCSATPGYAGLQGGVIAVGTDVPVTDAACVPLDIFGEGRPSPAAVAYVASREHADALLEQQVFNVNLGSTLFDIGGGTIRYNVGFEHHKESGDFQPDPYLAAGLGRNSLVLPVHGEYSSNEFFGEVVVPIVSERNAVPGIAELTITGKGRRVDNTINGKFTAWTGGLQWAPIKDFQLRGNVTRSLRAPAITELFLPITPGFGQVADPCSTANLSGGVRPEVRRANCAQFFAQYGLPSDGSWTSNAVSVSVPNTSQGNPDLENETANAWTAGFVLHPRWIDGLELAVDWVDIRVDNIITSISGNDLASACFDNFDYPNHYCDFIRRNPPGSADPGQITFSQSGFANGAFQSMAGVTLEGRYGHDFGPAGFFEVGVSYYRLREELRSTTGLTVTNSEEQIGSPTDTAQLNLIWEKGPVGARWQTNYVGRQLYSRTFNVESRDILEVQGDTTHNLSLEYQPRKDTTIRLAVTNIFDGAPPFPIGADSFNGNYDFLGRRYSLSATYDFSGK